MGPGFIIREGAKLERQKMGEEEKEQKLTEDCRSQGPTKSSRFLWFICVKAIFTLHLPPLQGPGWMPSLALTATGLTVLLSSAQTSTHSQFRTESHPNSFILGPSVGSCHRGPRSAAVELLIPKPSPPGNAVQNLGSSALLPEFHCPGRFELTHRARRPHAQPPHTTGALLGSSAGFLISLRTGILVLLNLFTQSPEQPFKTPNLSVLRLH